MSADWRVARAGMWVLAAAHSACNHAGVQALIHFSCISSTFDSPCLCRPLSPVIRYLSVLTMIWPRWSQRYSTTSAAWPRCFSLILQTQRWVINTCFAEQPPYLYCWTGVSESAHDPSVGDVVCSDASCKYVQVPVMTSTPAGEVGKSAQPFEAGNLSH